MWDLKKSILREQVYSELYVISPSGETTSVAWSTATRPVMPAGLPINTEVYIYTCLQNVKDKSEEENINYH